MNTTLYIIKIYHKEATVTVETNSPTVLLDTFEETLASNLPAEIVNGTTGEVMALSNCGCENYASEEFAMMFLEELIGQFWG